MARFRRGWALGNKQFKDNPVGQFLPVGQVSHLDGKDFAKANEVRWNRILDKCLSVMEKDTRDIRMDKKSVHWKALIALFMKDNTSVSDVWLPKHVSFRRGCVKRSIFTGIVSCSRHVPFDRRLMERVVGRIGETAFWRPTDEHQTTHEHSHGPIRSRSPTRSLA